MLRLICQIIAIESEASYPNGGNVCLFSATTCRYMSQCNLRSCRRAFARTERNLHCDVHVAAENKHTLPPFGLGATTIAIIEFEDYYRH